ncbi:50S ribosomal protein L11 methyltransferase [Haliangium ochraceum]|uniref:Ribosomal protein L11 methyltransferase n=1 Tax=Haliangium ochraceum (strain DSM 14365 / JCM 11303 / SMP-2) TaxID=502025 RepID=D0LGJ1_HALO1|nr:50S ribosomal protein L11 methyltransferase [Haliangium ochraceum]ACY12737.1 ribosomal L11 methyltransferase [Haliangium ochraceum DSM 14365]
MSEWVEIIIPVNASSADEVASLVADIVPEALRGTQVRGSEVVIWVAAKRRDEILGTIGQALSNMAECGLEVDAAGVRAREAAPEAEWRDLWKEFFHTTYLTEHVVVVPSWEKHEAKPGEIVIHLDPGQAFGTGAHASTRLVLGELEALRARGVEVQRCFDVGCGSGILFIAAAGMWPACSGVAVDIDPLAADATLENCERNGLSERVAVSTTPTEEVDGVFDLVLANIQADVLRSLAAPLTARVAPGGHLVLSGLLSHQAEAVGRDLAAAGGLELLHTRPDDSDPEWSSVLLARPGAAASAAE